VVYGALAVTAARVASGSSSGSSNKTSRGMTGKLMDLPGGQWLVVLVGVGFLVAAVVMAWQGWHEKFAEHLQTEGKLGYSGAGYLLLGKVGYIAKGIVFGLVGALFCYAGFTHEPQKSGGLDQALQEVLKQPFGPYLLFATALGLACYGLFALAQARHLDR
jgi:amino acid transporter